MRAAVALIVCCVTTAAAADRPVRKPLSRDEREAVLALMKAVDLAQDTDVLSPVDLAWGSHVLKSIDLGYVPFRVMLNALPELPKSAAMYVRVVSRHDGYRSTEEDSAIREWVLKGTALPPRQQEAVTFATGELPFGGPAVSSSRQSVSAPAQASAVLALQQKQYEKEKAAAEAAKRREEIKQRDPYVYPFEEYYFFDVKSPRVERAMAVPPGDYDVFVALVDRARVKTSTPTVVRHPISVPDFWNLELRLSELMFVDDVRTLNAPLAAKDQIEHPYTWGRAAVTPAFKTTFARTDELAVVYQICNYGAPDTDVTADYNFFWKIGGEWKLFNRTQPQQLDNGDLPGPSGWETQGFTMQRVPLQPFTPGEYKLQVVVKDRLTRQTAEQSITFTVK
jgi:hypothetical protein